MKIIIEIDSELAERYFNLYWQSTQGNPDLPLAAWVAAACEDRIREEIAFWENDYAPA